MQARRIFYTVKCTKIQHISVNQVSSSVEVVKQQVPLVHIKLDLLWINQKVVNNQIKKVQFEVSVEVKLEQFKTVTKCLFQQIQTCRMKIGFKIRAQP